MGLKRKTVRAIDKKIAELSDDLIFYDGDELERKIKEIRKLQKISADFKQPKISKEVWVELIKGTVMLTSLGAIIVYDSKGRVLPKTLERWLPQPRL